MVNHHFIKLYRRVEIGLHKILVSELGVIHCLAWDPAHPAPGARGRITQCVENWVGPRAGPNAMECLLTSKKNKHKLN
jgi:hypothetical protein